MDWPFHSPRPWHIIREASKPVKANFFACSMKIRSIIREQTKKWSGRTQSMTSLGVSWFLENPTVYRQPRPAVALSQILRGCSLPRGKKPPYCSSTKSSEEFLCAILCDTLGIFPQLLLCPRQGQLMSFS